jgi:hypothetical protein
MSRSTPHLCAEPGCPEIIEDGPGRCTEHRRPGTWDTFKARGGSDGYGASWRRLRNEYIGEHPNGERCGRPAEQVHPSRPRHPTFYD